MALAAPLRRSARTLVFALLAAMLATLVAVSPLAAQQRTGWLKTPAVIAQPGLTFRNALGAPDGADASVDLLLRLVTAIPTAIPRTTLVAAIEWSPLADEDAGGISRNEPGFLYGAAFSVLDRPRFAVDVDVLGEYTPAATLEDAGEQSYSHKLRLQGEVYYKLGLVLLGDATTGGLSRWQRSSAYGRLANTVTGVDDELVSPWTLQLGLSIPVAP